MSTATPPREAISHRQLVEAAILAPSPDNNQPWRFVSEDDRLLVYLDPERTLPSDVHSMFDLTGLGAAVENASIAARQLGYEPQVEYGNDCDGSVGLGTRPAAAITLAPGGQPDPLFEYLATRVTCRKLFSTRPVPESTLKRLAKEAAGLSEVRVDWVTDRRRIRSLARLVAASDRIRFEYEPFHNELFRQLRFTAEEAERTRDGLDLRTLELPPGAGALLARLRPWQRMKWVHRLHLGGLLTLPSALSVWRSGAIGLISVPEPNAASFLRGGQAFERVWLAATSQGLVLQPLGSPAIFFAHLTRLGGQKLSPGHRQRVRETILRFEKLVPSAKGRVLLMPFRLGHSSPPRFRSLRRPAEDVAQAATS